MDEVAVRPGRRRRVEVRIGQFELRQGIDVVECLVGRHGDTSDTFTKRGAHHWTRLRSANGNGLSIPVHVKFVTSDHAARLAKSIVALEIGEFLLGDLLERTVAREQPVAHEEGLHAIPDHVAIGEEIVVVFFLLGVNAGVQNESQRKPPDTFFHRDSLLSSQIPILPFCLLKGSPILFSN